MEQRPGAPDGQRHRCVADGTIQTGAVRVAQWCKARLDPLGDFGGGRPALEVLGQEDMAHLCRNATAQWKCAEMFPRVGMQANLLRQFALGRLKGIFAWLNTPSSAESSGRAEGDS